MTRGSACTCSIGAFGEHLALVHHRHAMRDALHELHVVLDHDDGAVLADLAEQLAGLAALGNAHAGDGLVEHQQLGLLHEQHPDLEPLLLAVAEKLGALIQAVSQQDLPGHPIDPIGDLLRPPEGERAENAAAAWKRDLQVLEHREVLVDGRRLELPPHAGVHDLVLGHARELLLLEADRSARRLGAAADEIEQRGLAGAVRADDHAQLVAIDVEVQRVHRLEAVERDREVFDVSSTTGDCVPCEHGTGSLASLPARRPTP